MDTEDARQDGAAWYVSAIVKICTIDVRSKPTLPSTVCDIVAVILLRLYFFKSGRGYFVVEPSFKTQDNLLLWGPKVTWSVFLLKLS